MHYVKSIFLSLVFALALILGPQSVSAQGINEGQLNAVSFKPLPMPLSLSVQPLDNSDLNMALKKEFEGKLREKGHIIDENANMVLTFETRDEIGAWKTRNKRAVLELQAKGGREGGENAKMRFNLFDSNTGGMFNEGKGETSIVTPSQYRMDVTIDNRSNGKRHWQGWMTANLGHSSGQALTRAMVPILVEKIGQTVKRQQIGQQ